MINVTYVGDTLYAYKGSGRSTVPSGEISFKADLSPVSPDKLSKPIQLGEEASEQWGIEDLPRSPICGQTVDHGESALLVCLDSARTAGLFWTTECASHRSEIPSWHCWLKSSSFDVQTTYNVTGTPGS
jgi:hypothetical protein